MGSWILRILLFLICGISGVALTQGISPSPPISLLGLIAGFLLAALTLLLEKGLKKIPLRNLLGSFIGLILAILIANLFSNVFFFNLLNHQQIVLPLLGALYGVCGYMGLRIGFKKGEEIHLPGWKLFSKNAPPSENAKILDTSVIIDGRIADIAETGFIEGAFIIPQFILNELQHIADSSDSIKRTRGKRGLEVLHHLQKQAGVDVRIMDRDYPTIKEVDSKLIELAKEVRGKIITNDSNLNNCLLYTSPSPRD